MDRRQSRDRRAFPIRREDGRRVTDPNVSHMKARLHRFVERSQQLGLLEQAAVGIWASARIEELEAELATVKAAWHRGGEVRAGTKTPEQHREWAVEASKRRWPARVRPPRLF